MSKENKDVVKWFEGEICCTELEQSLEQKKIKKGQIE